MKKIILRFSTILIYLLLVLSLSGFHLGSLIDMKSIVLTICGTILLSLGSIRKGMRKQELRSILSWNAIVVSYLTTFIFLFISLSTMKTESDLIKEIALNCRTLLYGFILFVLFKNEEEEKQNSTPTQGEKKKETSIHLKNDPEYVADEHGNLTAEDIYYKFRELGLTQREAEIARLARNGLSNKEIAEEMYIAETTVKKHMSHVFEKLQISNRESLKYIFENNKNPFI